MKSVLLRFCLLIVAHDCLAHRLDEYLQATRIAVFTNRIDMSCELTPGVDVANQVIETIDSDRDGLVSAEESTAYARRFLQDVAIGVDGKPRSLIFNAVSFPALPEIRAGIGVIRIRATSVSSPFGPGAHTLKVTNRHLPAISVYLVNALRSTDAGVELGKQTRDELQKDYRLEFRVDPLQRR